MKTRKATLPEFLPETMKNASLTRKQAQDCQGGWRNESDMDMQSQDGGNTGGNLPPY